MLNTEHGAAEADTLIDPVLSASTPGDARSPGPAPSLVEEHKPRGGWAAVMFARRWPSAFEAPEIDSVIWLMVASLLALAVAALGGASLPVVVAAVFPVSVTFALAWVHDGRELEPYGSMRPPASDADHGVYLTLLREAYDTQRRQLAAENNQEQTRHARGRRAS